MLHFRSAADAGVLQVYFDHARPRVDPVAANALFLFALAGRAADAPPTEAFVRAVLRRRAHQGGTPYYPLPESFLYAVSRLVDAFPAPAGAPRSPRRARERQRAAPKACALALAMGLLAAARCHELPGDATGRRLATGTCTACCACATWTAAGTCAPSHATAATPGAGSATRLSPPPSL